MAKKYAILSDKGVLTGFSQFDASSGIEVPEGCDLRLGEYKWDGKAFMPMKKGQDAVQEEPDVIRAIAHGFMAIRDGEPLPAATLAWLDYYSTTIEGKA